MQGNDSNMHIAYFYTSLDLTCTCAKFVTLDILCCHAFAILRQKYIPTISSKYILKKWSNEAKKMANNYNCNVTPKYANGAEIVFRNCAMRYAYDFIYMSQNKKETRKLMWKILENGHEALEIVMKKLSLDTNSFVEKDSIKKIDCGNNEILILDPPIAKTKGAPNSRKNGHFERKKKKETCPKARKREGCHYESSFFILIYLFFYIDK